MNRVGIYLLTEQLISEIREKTREAQVFADRLYLVTASFLDRSVEAWYKKMNRFSQPPLTILSPSSPDEEDGLLREVMREVFKCPWLVPAFVRTLDIDEASPLSWMGPGRRSFLGHSLGMGSCTVFDSLERAEDEYDTHMQNGYPGQYTRLAGLFFDPSALINDWDIYDFSLHDTMRKDYTDACNAIVEMGGKNTWNVPRGGYIRVISLLGFPFTTAVMKSMWAATVMMGGFLSKPVSGSYRASLPRSINEMMESAPLIMREPFSSVTAFDPSATPRTKSSTRGVRVKGGARVARARRIDGDMARLWGGRGEKVDPMKGEEASTGELLWSFRSLHWNLSQSFSISYLLSEIILENSGSTSSYPPTLLPSLPLRPISPRSITSAKQEAMENGLMAALLIRRIAIPRDPNVAERTKGLVSILSPSSYNAILASYIKDKPKWSALIRETFTKPDPVDLARFNRLIRLVSRIRSMNDLSVREKALSSIKVDVVFDEDSHQYFTPDGIAILCEHTMDELTRLVMGEVSFSGVIAGKYAAEGHEDISNKGNKVGLKGERDTNKSIGDESIDDTPLILTCRYCGMDLGSDWLVAGGMGGEGEGDAGEMLASTRRYLDDSVGIIISKMIGTKSVSTTIAPVLLIKSVYALIGLGLNGEIGKLKPSETRNSRVRFLELAAAISSLSILAKAGAPIVINTTALESHITKEYLLVFQDLGFAPKMVMPRMIDFWPSALSKYFPHPDKIITEVMYSIGGLQKDTVLLEMVRSILERPLAAAFGEEEKERYRSTLPLLSQSRSDENGPSISAMMGPYNIRPSFKVTPPFHRDSLLRMIDGLRGASRGARRLSRSIVSGSSGEREGKGTDMPSETTRLAIVEAVSVICPDLLLHPLSSVQWGEEAVEVEELSDHVFSPSIQYGPHAWVDGGERRCERCGLTSQMKRSMGSKDVSAEAAAYLGTYAEVLGRKWLSLSYSALRLPSQPPRPQIRETMPSEEELVAIEKKFFSMYHETVDLSSRAAIMFVAHTASRIGFYSVGKEITSGGVKERDAAVRKAWGLIMRWGIEPTNEERMRRSFDAFSLGMMMAI
jgi:hypothetical protein